MSKRLVDRIKSLLPSQEAPPQNSCRAPGCNKPVNREGHKLCYDHYKQQQSGALVKKDSNFKAGGREAPNPPPARQEPDRDQLKRLRAISEQTLNPPLARQESGSRGGADMLTASKLGKALDLPGSRVNLILAELGWIEKFTEGWKVTRQGEKQGGQTQTFKQQGKGIPYAVWPGKLIRNYVFLAAVNEIGRDAPKETAEVREGPLLSSSEKPQVADLRTRFPAKYRAADGHYVRSRAELSIDNWLYMHAIVHAYERKLPVEEDAYCDFYLPQSKVYIEYWGMEKDPAYAQRKKEKQAIYTRHGLNLVELADAELENLDDNIVRLLLPFGVDCA